MSEEENLAKMRAALDLLNLARKARGETLPLPFFYCYDQESGRHINLAQGILYRARPGSPLDSRSLTDEQRTVLVQEDLETLMEHGELNRVEVLLPFDTVLASFSEEYGLEYEWRDPDE